MAAITWDDVLLFAPELSTFDSDAQDEILLFVNEEGIDVTQWGGEDAQRLRLARIYYAAHIATASSQGGNGGAAGPVTSETAGGLSRTYAFASVASDLLLDSTNYGRLLRMLMRQTIARAPVVL